MKFTITLLFIGLLANGFSQDVIAKTGALCEESLTLSVALEPGNTVVSWHKDGVELVGELSPSLNCASYGAGNYAVVLLKSYEEVTITIDVLAEEVVLADFKGTNYLAAAVTFFADESTATNEIVAWHWDFGNGETSSLQHPRVMFSEQKDYLVTLTVTTNSGCKQSISKIHNWSF